MKLSKKGLGKKKSFQKLKTLGRIITTAGIIGATAIAGAQEKSNRYTQMLSGSTAKLAPFSTAKVEVGIRDFNINNSFANISVRGMDNIEGIYYNYNSLVNSSREKKANSHWLGFNYILPLEKDGTRGILAAELPIGNPFKAEDVNLNIDQHITSYGALGLGFVMKENAYLLAMLDFLDKDADLVSALAESRPAFVPRGIADKVGLGGRVKVSIPITPKKSDIQAYLNLYGQMVWAEGSEDKNHVGKIGFNVEAFLGKIHQVSLRLGLEKCTGIHDSVVGNVGLAYSFYQRPWYETKYN